MHQLLLNEFLNIILKRIFMNDKASGRINDGKFGRLAEILLEEAPKKKQPKEENSSQK